MLVLVPFPTPYRRRGAPHISSAPTQGHPSPGRSAPPRFATESVRADTLRAHPENAAAPAQYPSEERRYRPKVTSGCPKRSEGGFPVGTRTITAFPSGTVHPTRKQNYSKAPESSDPRAFSYSRFRRQSLPRCRSPPQPSAHEYAAPYPAPSPPGTRPRDESPWRSRRDPHRRTAP